MALNNRSRMATMRADTAWPYRERWQRRDRYGRGAACCTSGERESNVHIAITSASSRASA